MFIFSNNVDKRILHLKRLFNSWSIAFGIVVPAIVIMIGIGLCKQNGDPTMLLYKIVTDEVYSKVALWTLLLNLGYLVLVGLYRLFVVDIAESL